MSEWAEFEQLAAQIYSELAPTAEVLHDDSIAGVDSGVNRQIDVSIRFSIAGHPVLMVVQARDYAEPLDINGVGEFATVIKDVRANKGILIARSGFTQGAKNLARNLGIDLCNIHDAQSRKWAMDVALPIAWVDLKPNLGFFVMAKFEAGDSIPEDSTKWVLSADEGKTRITVFETFVREWNAGRLNRTVGATHRVRPANQEEVKALALDKDGSNVWRPVRSFELVYTVEQRAWLGSFTPDECRGLFDYQTNAFHVSYLPIGSIPLQRDDSWQEINDYEELAVTVPGLLVTTESWQVDPSSLESRGMDFTYLGPDFEP